jgi:hypothetical protein
MHCEGGTFKFALVDCGCPDGQMVSQSCDVSSFSSAADAVCVSTPDPTPSPTAATPVPTAVTPVPTPYPTASYTPYPTPTPYPTYYWNPYPTSSPYPTYKWNPYPTSSPYPTYGVFCVLEITNLLSCENENREACTGDDADLCVYDSGKPCLALPLNCN